MKQNNSNNNCSLSINYRQLNNYNNKNKILNFGKINNDNYDEAINKYSLKFFEKLGKINNKNNNNYRRITNLNEIANQMSKSNLINFNKEIILYNKDKKNLKYNNNEILWNKVKIKKEESHDTKNENSSYSSLHNIKLFGTAGNNIDYYKNIQQYNEDYNTLAFERKFSDSKNKLNKIIIDKNTRNESNRTIGIKVSKFNSTSPQNKNEYNNDDKKKGNVIKKHHNLNKLKDSINTNENIIIINSKKLSITDNPSLPSISNNKKVFTNILNNPMLTSKEKALYILSNSHVLPLKSQIILSRGSDNLRKKILKKNLLMNYEAFLKNKIKQYEEKQRLYTEKIQSHFNPTKIAEITLNFITTQSEKLFNEHYIILLNNKKDPTFIYYKNYIKVIYYIINESLIDENNNEINDNILLTNLNNIINKKGFKTIKDYLYFLFISNNTHTKEKSFINNIDKIDDIINKEVPDLLNFDESLKMCKFIIYSLYLIKEIIEFATVIKKTIELKIEENEFIQYIKNILDKFTNKYLN
jgi:hypothetical protein